MKKRKIMSASEMASKANRLRRKRLGEKGYSEYMRNLVLQRKKNPVKERKDEASN